MAWPLHFAPTRAYEFASAVLQLLPEMEVVAAKRELAQRRSAGEGNPYTAHWIFASNRRLLVSTIIVFILCTLIGLIMAANVADVGLLHRASPFVVVIPFLSGPFMFASVLLHWCFKVRWVVRNDRQHIETERALQQRVVDELPELQLTTLEARRLNSPSEP